MNECLRCGQAGMRHVTHVCMTAMGPPSLSNLPSLQHAVLDTHHWLYKAGYEQGRLDAERERDLSPLGKTRKP